MDTPSRRELLAVSATGVALSLSGCLNAFARYLGADEQGEFVVALTNLRRPSGTDNGPGTPSDVVARIDVENRRSDRLSGRLEMELRYMPEGEVERSWTKTDDLEVQGGISPQLQYIFDSAYQFGSEVPGDYEIDAEIVDVEVVDS